MTGLGNPLTILYPALRGRVVVSGQLSPPQRATGPPIHMASLGPLQPAGFLAG
jgi:hypothetical protein